MSFIDLITQGLSQFSISEVSLSFAPLFFTIDIIGAIPIVLAIKQKNQSYSPVSVAIYSAIILLAFLFIGEPLLEKLGVDINSFGVAGGIVLFVMAVEMVFGLEIFREDGPTNNATFIPLVFPLFAGAATFASLISLRVQGFAVVNIAISLLLNMVVIYLGLKFVDPIERLLGKNGVYILRKFFGVVLLAISVKFITNSLIAIIAGVKAGVAMSLMGS